MNPGGSSVGKTGESLRTSPKEIFFSDVLPRKCVRPLDNRYVDSDVRAEPEIRYVKFENNIAMKIQNLFSISIALDAPRIQIDGGTSAGVIQLEDGITEEVRKKLQDMGHKSPTILKGWDRQNFGVGQIITRNRINGVLCGGSDPRNDGLAIGW